MRVSIRSIILVVGACVSSAVSPLGQAQIPRSTIAPTVPTLPPKTTTPTMTLPLPLQPPPTLVTYVPLTGFVDLHAHPMAHLGFGGKLISGGTDADPNGNGALLPADPACNQSQWVSGVSFNPAVRATSEIQALGPENSIHGGPNIAYNGCGNQIRATLIHVLQGALGAADWGDSTYTQSGISPNNQPFAFYTWPTWNDVTRQKMWVEWVRRAFTGGLHVMVALAVNNKLLADATVFGNVTGKGDLPTDDATSADIQLNEIKRMVSNSNFMQIAFKSSDVYNIVSSGKMAVVLGVEVDHIGNLTGGASSAQVVAEVDRLFNEGVRYIFPIHLTDNALGGAAAYQDLFDVANVYEEGHPFNLVCASPSDGINYHEAISPSGTAAQVMAQLQQTIMPGKSPPPAGPLCGNVNGLGLTQAGIDGIREMMKKGMLIDIDHMSQAAYMTTIGMATQRATDGSALMYPLNSGHNGERGFLDPTNTSERGFPVSVYQTLGRLHGMAGVGSAKLNSFQWLSLYQRVILDMSNNGAIQGIAAGFGTDMNGLEFQMPPRPSERDIPDLNANARNACIVSCTTPGSANSCLTTSGKPDRTACPQCTSDCNTTYPVKPGCVANCGIARLQYTPAFPMSTDAGRAWDYNVEGVAHYGLLADVVQDLRTYSADGANTVNNSLMHGADYFFNTWRIAELRSAVVP